MGQAFLCSFNLQNQQKQNFVFIVSLIIVHSYISCVDCISKNINNTLIKLFVVVIQNNSFLQAKHVIGSDIVPVSNFKALNNYKQNSFHYNNLLGIRCIKALGNHRNIRLCALNKSTKTLKISI